GRINSTWGGNLCDMVRSTHYLRIYEQERLAENAAAMGRRLLEGGQRVADETGAFGEVRGRGLRMAFTLAGKSARDGLGRRLFGAGLLVLRSGEQSLRLRPALDITAAVVDEALEVLRGACCGRE